jgi:hypothetical protein
MKDIREWADTHGEPRMTMRQFEEEERRARDLADEELREALAAGFCCVSAGMHMGHDEDCEGYHPDCPTCGGRGWTEYPSGVVAPDGYEEYLKEPCSRCGGGGRV